MVTIPFVSWTRCPRNSTRTASFLTQFLEAEKSDFLKGPSHFSEQPKGEKRKVSGAKLPLVFQLFLLQVLPSPIGSMYGVFSYIYHKNQPNVGKYTIHGSYGIDPFSHPKWRSRFTPFQRSRRKKTCKFGSL